MVRLIKVVGGSAKLIIVGSIPILTSGEFKICSPREKNESNGAQANLVEALD
jgi:hypothetical protein